MPVISLRDWPAYLGAAFGHSADVGFDERNFTSADNRARLLTWGDWRARLNRYQVFWSHYDGTVYRAVHPWAGTLKDRYGLYSYTRSIFSPAYRIGEFWATHLMGGNLDPDAGDGSEVPTALPIATENPALRACIAQIWRDSNWQAVKETWTRFGSVLGDAPLMVLDDPARQRVTIRPVHPQELVRVLRDPATGDVTGYVLMSLREDPELPSVPGSPPTQAAYAEVAEKVGGSVEFSTWRNGAPYDWGDSTDDAVQPADGPAATWTEPYGFVPLVLAQHRDMGLGWGWSELQPTLSKLHEVDDLASKLNDQVRKTVDCLDLFVGMAPPNTQSDLAAIEFGDDAGDDAGRSGRKALYAPNPGARWQPMVAPLDIAATSAHIAGILAEIERQHPELQADMATASGDASGRALRVARERVEAMVHQRRSNYDSALVKAHRMAIHIGALKGYPGFEAFTADSLARGDLDHAIADRPVFAVDDLDRLERAQAKLTAIQTGTLAGLPLASTLEIIGETPAQIAAIVAARDQEQAEADARLAAQQQQQTQAAPAAQAGTAVGAPATEAAAAQAE